MSRVGDGLIAVRERIRVAAEGAGRDPASVELVAVSKRHGLDAIREAYALGQRAFGENYVKEMIEKARALEDLEELRWHFVGHLQRNKVKDVIACGAKVETVDSLRLAETLAKRAEVAGLRMPIWLQVNVSGEAQKSGCAPDALAELVSGARELEALDVRGLMAVPPFDDDPEASRPWFRQLREEAERHALDGLSMGMSGDLEVAIEEGSTLVRVGTAIFGPRPD